MGQDTFGCGGWFQAVALKDVASYEQAATLLIYSY